MLKLPTRQTAPQSAKTLWKNANLKVRDFLNSMCFSGPSFLGMLIFYLVPFGVVIYYSFIAGVVDKSFVGLKNYIAVFNNAAFRTAAKNTAVFTGLAVPLLFDQSPMVYLTFLLVLFTAIFFGKTRAGLSYKAVGEHPQAAATLGIPVVGVKYLACVICGALSGIGGAYLTTCYSSTYTDGIVAGRGFIALAAVIFGRWNAGGILLACLFFGFCDALQIRLQVSGIAIPYQFFQMIPYVATVVVLTLIGARQAGPKANGKPYRREQR